MAAAGSTTPAAAVLTGFLVGQPFEDEELPPEPPVEEEEPELVEEPAGPDPEGP